MIKLNDITIIFCRLIRAGQGSELELTESNEAFLYVGLYKATISFILSFFLWFLKITILSLKK